MFYADTWASGPRPCATVMEMPDTPAKSPCRQCGARPRDGRHRLCRTCGRVSHKGRVTGVTTEPNATPEPPSTPEPDRLAPQLAPYHFAPGTNSQTPGEVFRRGPDQDVLTASRIGRRIWVKALATVIPGSRLSGAERLVERLHDVIDKGERDEVLRLASILAPALGENGKNGNGNGHGRARETRIVLPPEMGVATQAAPAESPLTLNGETYSSVSPDEGLGASSPERARSSNPRPTWAPF